MLILNTPDGDFAIAKGNIHTIQEDYDVGYYYVTKDIASYPFRSINGIEVKTLTMLMSWLINMQMKMANSQ